MTNITKAKELLYFVAGIGIDTDHGEFYNIPLDDYVSRAESVLWEARTEHPLAAKAWAWCFAHCYPGGWADEDGARKAYFACREAIPNLKKLEHHRQFLKRERKRALKSAFLSGKETP